MKKRDKDANLNHVDELSVEGLSDDAAITKIWVLQNLASVLVHQEGYRDTLVVFWSLGVIFRGWFVREKKEDLLDFFKLL